MGGRAAGAAGGLALPQLLHRCCQVLSLLVGLHNSGCLAVDLKPSNLLLLEDHEQQQQQGVSGGRGLVLADAPLHFIMAGALKQAWPSEAALADPYYK